MSIEADRYLLKGPMPEIGEIPTTDIEKMTKRKLKTECEMLRALATNIKAECIMWRNVWSWVPSEVKYYVARVGQQVGITQRNYKRYLGVLLDSHWVLDELELGIEDKVYDTVTGKYFWEQKVIKTKLGAIIDFQIIKQRIEVTEGETEQQEEEQPTEDETIKQSDNQL